VPLQLERQLEFGANAIGTRDQYRLAIAFRHFEQGAKATDTAEHPLAKRFSGQGLDSFDQFIAGIDVDPGVTIGEGFLSHLVARPEQGWRMPRSGRMHHSDRPIPNLIRNGPAAC